MTVNIKKDFNDLRKQKTDISSLVYGKVPPQSIDLEKMVLGALMLEKDRISDVLRVLPSSDAFYVNAHQKIYEAIIEMYRVSMPVDISTVMVQLKKMGELETVGGSHYLMTITADVVTSAHIESHAMIIAENWMKRQIIQMAGEAISKAYDDTSDVFELLNSSSLALDAITVNVNQGEPKLIEDVYQERLLDIEERRSRNENISGGSTGFFELDEILNGLQKKKLVIIAARPGVGKTAFALQLTSSLVSDTDKCSGLIFFSMEMDDMELVDRKMASMNQVFLDRINKPVRLDENDLKRLSDGYSKLPKKKILLDDTASLSWIDMRTKVRKMKHKYGISHIVVDYLQLMSGDRTTGRGNREQEISTISRELKRIAMEFDVCIIALSQMSREVEKRKDQKPQLSDLRESGAIEQDANVVIFLWKPTDEDIENEPEIKDLREIIIAKNRGGDIGAVRLRWSGAMQTFSPLQPFNTPTQQRPEFESPYTDGLRRVINMEYNSEKPPF